MNFLVILFFYVKSLINFIMKQIKKLCFVALMVFTLAVSISSCQKEEPVPNYPIPDPPDPMTQLVQPNAVLTFLG